MGAGHSRDGHKLIESLPFDQREGIVVVPPKDEELALTTMKRAFCGYGTIPEFGLDWIFSPVKGHEVFKPLPPQSDGSFQQDPVHWACYRWLFRFCLYEMAQTGLVFGIKNTEARGGDGGEGYAAVMLCQPPGYSGGLVSSLVAGYKAGLVPPWENTKDEKLLQVKARMDGMMPMMKKCHKECAPEKHWYIYMLQVDPSHQGQKLGKRLLSFVFALADEQGVPTYLETVGDRNIAIYEKLGFKVVNKYPCMVGQGAKIGGPGLTEGGGMTGMKRPPSASAA